jgi:SAM-dependent methyltransferase
MCVDRLHMLNVIQEWVNHIVQSYLSQPGRVLEIGSMNVNGSVREYFTEATEYIGIDMQEGNGVDIVMPSTNCISKWGQESFDTVLCLEVLEHDRTFWRTVEDMRLLVKRGGHMIITTPSYLFPYHGYPKDYYRFSEDTYNEVFFTGWEKIEAVQFHSGTSIGVLGKRP